MTITTAPEEVREIEAKAEPIRERVKAMMADYQRNRRSGEEVASSSMAVQEKFADYRPDSGNGE